ncbi:MAG: alkaline phosphatase family protein [Kofleriaceae bacterium]|nr:alkaline phosphatase family protein [Kofleriaceae bacterium]
MTVAGVGWTERVARVVMAGALALVALALPDVRRAFIDDVVRRDAPPGPGPALPAAPPGAAGLEPVPWVRVVLIDGTNAADARAMPAWNALCARGLDLDVDVGFPTVSLPVQTALWSGLTQQQTGVVYHYGAPLPDPLGVRAIPAQVARNGGAVAVAEAHPEIVGSMGFAPAEPPLVDGLAVPDGWDATWQDAATRAVAGDARLAFVHVLRVDAAGHKHGRGSPAWRDALASADAILGALVAAGDAAHPDARWLVLADHGHVAAGGHGSADPAIRIVRACLAGPGVAVGRGGPLALVDVSRALADSVGATLPKAARGRPLAGALAAPLRDDELVPAPSRGRRAMAWLLLIAGALVTAWALGRRAMLWAPWWWPVAIALVVIRLGPPSLAVGYVFKSPGRGIADAAALATYAAALWTAAAVHYAARPAWRVAVAQLAVPVACVLAALALCGGLPLLWGDVAVPVAPRWTAWSSVGLVIVVRALWAVALALLATAFLPAFDPSGPRGTRRSGS